MVTKKSSMFIFSTLFILFVLTIVSSVSANDFIAERENINFRISPDETARYNISITNILDENSRYSLSLSIGDSLNWVSYPSYINVPAQSTESFVFTLSPKYNTNIGVYQVNLNIKSDISEQVLQIPVDLSYDGMFFGFTPNIELTLNLPQTIDPRASATIGVNIKNRNPLNIEEAELRIRSDLFFDDRTISIPSGPHRTSQEGISQELVFIMNPLQSPGEYKVVVQVYHPKSDKIISEEEGVVRIIDYAATPSKIETTKKLFVVEHKITVENFGNREATAELKLSASRLKKMLSMTSHEAQFEKVNGESYLLWTPTLEPTEKLVIIVQTNYWPLVIAILIIVLAFVSYFLLRSPVILEKEIAVIDEDIGEGSSDLRVRLFIKNRSGHSVYNISVSDKVRGITDYVESSQLGHVKPSRTNKTSKKGTMLYWDFDELEAYEERIFTYKLKSKLKVVGDLTLPKAKAKFESKNNKERKILSDKPYFKKINKKVSE